MTIKRDVWGSRLGFIAAAAGSAVGLGNLWKFPYITWDNNGGAFVIVYLVSCLFLGLPIMMAEILIGRTTRLSGAPAFKKLGGNLWSKLGYVGAVTGGIILSYYMVIAGWSIRSFGQCLNWSIRGYTPMNESDFGDFLSNGSAQIGLTAAFTLANSLIIWKGIGAGIEKTTKIIMPILVLILLYLVITALSMPGRNDALSLIFSADFANMPAKGYLEAVGQSFFSLSLGLGAMVAYGSYMRRQDMIPSTAAWVVFLDTIFALLSCLAMFTIIMSVPELQQSVDEQGTVGMLFITLPELFYTRMPGGVILAPLFFVLVGFAALSSTLSLGEVVTSILIDRKGWKRSKAVIISSLAVFLGSVFAALSLGAVDGLTTISFENNKFLHIFFGNKTGVLSLLDHLATNWLMPLGGLGITIFVGWYLKPDFIEANMNIKRTGVIFKIWLWSLRILAPLAILILVAAVIAGGDFS